MACDHEDDNDGRPHEVGGGTACEGKARNNEEHGRNRSNGSRLPHENHDEPHDADHKSHDWSQVDEPTYGSGNALATLEPVPDRERVAHYGCEQGHVSELWVDGERADRCCTCPFQSIANKDNCSELLAKRSQNVGGPWVSGTDRANVDTGAGGNDDAKVDASEEIRGCHRKELNHSGDCRSDSHDRSQRARRSSNSGTDSIRSFVLLLARPPYLRWAIAALIMVAAILWELSDRATEAVPFASTDIARGEAIVGEHVEWRDIPVGSVEGADLSNASALTDIGRGDPLTASVAGGRPPIPDGWWSIPVDLPPGVPAGSPVRLTVSDGSSVNGMISIAASTDQFGIAVPGTVAVPESAVDGVAAAAATGALLVLVAP